MKWPLLGAHTTVAGGIERAPELAEHLGYNTIQIFARNRAAWDTPPYEEGRAERFKDAVKRHGIRATMTHTSYLISLCSEREEVRHRSLPALRDELDRAEQLAIPGVVMHPGSPGDLSRDWGILTIADALNQIFDETPDQTARVLLETTAGQGRSIGCRFEDLADIIDRVEQTDRIGVCLDTCHIFAAGYDIRRASLYEETMRAFDETIGLNRLRAIHLNDSLKPFNSHVDRHAPIGRGHIGLTAFGHLLNDHRLRDIPMVLETPKSADFHEDIENLAALRQVVDWSCRRRQRENASESKIHA